MEMQGDGQLEGIESANLAGESVACDQVLGAVVMRVEEANNLISPPGDLGREEPPQTGEFSEVERSGSDLDGEGRDGLDQRHPRDEQLGPRYADESVHHGGPGFRVVVLDQSAGIKEEAGHLKAFRALFFDDHARHRVLDFGSCGADFFQGDGIVSVSLAVYDNVVVDEVIRDRECLGSALVLPASADVVLKDLMDVLRHVAPTPSGALRKDPFRVRSSFDVDGHGASRSGNRKLSLQRTAEGSILAQS